MLHLLCCEYKAGKKCLDSIKILMARTGVEPATLALLAPRSNQLS